MLLLMMAGQYLLIMERGDACTVRVWFTPTKGRQWQNLPCQEGLYSRYMPTFPNQRRAYLRNPTRIMRIGIWARRTRQLHHVSESKSEFRIDCQQSPSFDL